MRKAYGTSLNRTYRLVGTVCGIGGSCIVIAVFRWLDKLGFAARLNQGVVIRQTFYGGRYGLLDVDLNPTPVSTKNGQAKIATEYGLHLDYMLSFLLFYILSNLLRQEGRIRDHLYHRTPSLISD